MFMQILKLLILCLYASHTWADLYENEPNNSAKDAQTLLVNTSPKTFKFDYLGDEDWVVFYAQKGTPYNIEIPDKSVGKSVNPAITLYDAQGEVVVPLFDFNFAGEGETLAWNRPSKSGFYYLKITNQSKTFSAANRYAIHIFVPFAPQNVYIDGKVLDQCTNKGLANALVIGSSGDQQLTAKSGEFGVALSPGSYTFTASYEGYQELSQTVTELKLQQETIVKPVEFVLKPRGSCPGVPIVPTPIPQPEQVVAEFNATSGILLVKDVRIGGNQAIAAELKMQADGSFTLLKVTPLSGSLYGSPAYYDFDTGLARIPYVIFADQLFSASLLGKGANVYILNETPKPAVFN